MKRPREALRWNLITAWQIRLLFVWRLINLDNVSIGCWQISTACEGKKGIKTETLSLAEFRRKTWFFNFIADCLVHQRHSRSSDFCFAISVTWQLLTINGQYLFFEACYCCEFLGQLLFKCFFIILSGDVLIPYCYDVTVGGEKKYFRAPFLVLQVVTNKELYSR